MQLMTLLPFLFIFSDLPDEAMPTRKSPRIHCRTPQGTVLSAHPFVEADRNSAALTSSAEINIHKNRSEQG
jgi:hypothetical protein